MFFLSNNSLPNNLVPFFHQQTLWLYRIHQSFVCGVYTIYCCNIWSLSLKTCGIENKTKTTTSKKYPNLSVVSKKKKEQRTASVTVSKVQTFSV